MIIPSSLRALVALLLSALLCACAASTPPPAAPAPVLSPADQLYEKAYVLWGRADTCADPERAIALLNSALDLDARHAPALLRRGLAYAQLGHHEDAFDDITASISLAPTADAYAWRAFALLQEGRLEGAQADLAFALKLDKKNRRAWAFLGLLRLSQERPDEACQALREAASLGDSTWLDKARTQNLCR